MSGIDVASVLEALTGEGEGLQKNTNSLTGLAKEVNSVLSEFESTVRMLENMHVLPVLVRAAGKKLDIDVESPLSSGGARSEYHSQLFAELNAMGEDEIKGLLAGRASDEDGKSESGVSDTNK